MYLIQENVIESFKRMKNQVHRFLGAVGISPEWYCLVLLLLVSNNSSKNKNKIAESNEEKSQQSEQTVELKRQEGQRVTPEPSHRPTTSLTLTPLTLALAAAGSRQQPGPAVCSSI